MSVQLTWAFTNTYTKGSDGGDSIFASITATGGGGGASGPFGGNTGGSGGGSVVQYCNLIIH